MKKLAFLPILFLLLLNMNCEKNSNSGKESYPLPPRLFFSLHNSENSSNLLFGESAIYSPDSVSISFSNTINYVAIDYDALRKAISLDYPISPNTEEISWYLKLTDELIDTITLYVTNIEFSSDLRISDYSYSLAFKYNGFLICDSCKSDSIYKIYK